MSTDTAGRRYEVTDAVGKGGFGTVYKARLLGEGGFAKVVALKVLNPDMEGVDDVAQRLRDEARLLGLLRHRVIVQVDGLIRVRGRWAVVMEFVDGVELKSVIADSPMEPAPALEVIGEIAGALHVAYTTEGPDGQPLRLLHRDIKPSNIQLTRVGETKVLDFGIARADFGSREAETRSLMYGSLLYMAPERHDFIDGPAGDIYALGCVLFEALAGEPLGKSSANPKRHAALVEEKLATLEVSQDLHDFLASMLAYEPDERPTARVVERTCNDLRRSSPGPLLRDLAEERVPRLQRQQPTVTDAELTGTILMEETGRMQARAASTKATRRIPVVPIVALVGVLIAVLAGSIYIGKGLQKEDQLRAGRAKAKSVDKKLEEPAPTKARKVAEVEPKKKAKTKVAKAKTRPKAAPKPKATPKAAPKPSNAGTVRISGDASKVELVKGSKRYPVPGQVPAGTYKVEAIFPGNDSFVAAGSAVVVKGSTVALSCDGFFTRCVKK